MQTTLETKPKPEFKPEIDFELYCTRCVLKPDTNLAASYVKGKLRALLQPVSLNIYLCPSCKTQYYRRAFFGKKARKVEPLEPCDVCGYRSFKYDRKRRELVCVKCGLTTR